MKDSAVGAGDLEVTEGVGVETILPGWAEVDVT